MARSNVDKFSDDLVILAHEGFFFFVFLFSFSFLRKRQKNRSMYSTKIKILVSPHLHNKRKLAEPVVYH